MSTHTVPTPPPDPADDARVASCPVVTRQPGEQRRTIPTHTRATVYARDAFTCQTCHTGPLPSMTTRTGNEPYITLDHIIEWHRGGCDHEHNLRVVCSSCNPRIGNTGPDADRRRQAAVAGSLAKRARLKARRA